MTTVPASAVDGRSLRRERNRQDIVDALLGLIENGETEISAALIASKAGLSERSIFRSVSYTHLTLPTILRV